MDREQIEDFLKSKGLDGANSVKSADIADLVSKSKREYHVFADAGTTVCHLTLPNGYSVVGAAFCVDRASYNETLGQKIALDRAKDQVFALEGYLLRSVMDAAEKAGAS